MLAVLAAVAAWAAVICSFASLCTAVYAALNHFRLSPPAPLPPPKPGPVTWLFAPDADPAAVARLEEELRRPLAEVVAQAERVAIARHSPLTHPHKATVKVKNCAVSDPRQFPLPPEAIEVTGLGDPQASYILPPGATYTPTVTFGGGGGTSVSGECVPCPRCGIYGYPHACTPRAAELLSSLREQRGWAQQQVKELTIRWEQGHSWGTAEDDARDEWRERVRVLDQQIRMVEQMLYG